MIFSGKNKSSRKKSMSETGLVGANVASSPKQQYFEAHCGFGSRGRQSVRAVKVEPR